MSIEIDLTELAGRRVLCAVSGGADSICLLHKLWSEGIELTAAHFEHGIRGVESRRDAEFVRAWCEARKIPCVIGYGDTPEYAQEHGMGLEEAARALRYRFLERTADELDCELIATAHNLSDNAETLLFNLCRGAGSAGLRGIPRRRGRLIRPLLTTARQEIEEYLGENGLEHMEDSTNGSDEYSRNRIRHSVMPALREINPEADAAMSRAAMLAGRDDDCLNTLAKAFLDEHYDGESLPLSELNALHNAVASRVIRMTAKRSLSMEQVEKALALARCSEAHCLDLPGQRIRFEQGRLWTEAREAEKLPERILRPGERVLICEAGLAIQAEMGVYRGEINDLFKTYFLKYENIKGNVMITGRRPGDRLRPHGRGCTKSLKSLFLEAGYTQRQRELTPVLRDEGGVLTVYGIAADERTAPEDGDRVLKITIETLGEKP